MTEKSDHPSWNEKEFVTFLLIYAAHVDFDFSKEEMERIYQYAGEECYCKMKEEFDGMSDFSALQSILACKGLYYPTPDRRAELLQEVKKILLADGEYNSMEMEWLEFMNKLM